MGLTDILSTSTLICLAIMLLLVGAVAMFFMQKMSEQNHKIASMLGLVSTMAEELNFVRSRVQILSANTLQQGGGVGNTSNLAQSDNSLIEVSDHDEEEDDNEDSSDNESDDENDDESDDKSDDKNDDESYDDSDEGSDQEDDKQNIKTINMGETLEASFHCEALEDEEPGESSFSNSELDDDLESVNDENLEEEVHEKDNTDTFAVTNDEFIKSIDISTLEESHKDAENFDYKKMSLNKLRSIVVEKGLTTDSSKLKKNDLLKLLNDE